MKEKKEKYISENETYGGKPTTFGGKLANFWYHHKFGTIVTCLAVVLLTVIIVQLINRPEYDLNIIYAGGQKISRIQVDGKTSQQENVFASLNRVGEDFDENGEVNLSLSDYYYLTDEEITRLEADGKGDTIDYQKLAEDRDAFHNNIMTGDACLLFLSEALFDELYNEKAFSDGALFANLDSIIGSTDAQGYEYYGDSKKAIKLHSLKFSELPGICDLPADTVICLRNQNNMGVVNKNEEVFVNSKVLIKKIFDFGY